MTLPSCWQDSWKVDESVSLMKFSAFFLAFLALCEPRYVVDSEGGGGTSADDSGNKEGEGQENEVDASSAPSLMDRAKAFLAKDGETARRLNAEAAQKKAEEERDEALKAFGEMEGQLAEAKVRIAELEESQRSAAAEAARIAAENHVPADELPESQPDETATMTREELSAEYRKLKGQKEKQAFLKRHADALKAN